MLRERDIVEQGTGVFHTYGGPMFSQVSTGDDTQMRFSNQQKIHWDMLPYLLLSRTTGAELPENSPILVIVAIDIASDTNQTGYHAPLHITETLRARFSPARFNQVTYLDISPAVKQVEWLREISGLTIERLAEIFDVSRITYHKWLGGSPLRDSHREHVLEVLPLMEEAIQRLGNSQSVSNWLLTPASPGGKKPVEYLKERRYNLFRGFLLHTPTGREKFRPVSPSNRVPRERPHNEIEQVRRLLKPRGWMNDGEDTDISEDN